MWSSEPDGGRRRSYITRPGYRLGMKPANYGRKYPPEVLSPDEMSRLLAACSQTAPAGIRNRALIVVLWRAGLRIAEALALHQKDVDLQAGVIQVLHGKGDRRRVVGIDPQATLVLSTWIECRAKLGLDYRHPLFCGVRRDTFGNPMWSSYVRDTLKRLGRKAGIEKRVHPHGLRHTHAAELARESTPVHIIRRQLGHNSLVMTQRYIDHLEPLEVVRVMQSRSWGPEGPELLAA